MHRSRSWTHPRSSSCARNTPSSVGVLIRHDIHNFVAERIVLLIHDAQIYLFCGSTTSKNSIVFSYLEAVSIGICRKDWCMTYMVKTMPPLNINRANRGTAPDQKVRSPSSFQILAMQWKLFLYSAFAWIDCILVLTVSRGMVA